MGKNITLLGNLKNITLLNPVVEIEIIKGNFRLFCD